MVTFIGVPTLAWSTFELWHDRRRVRIEEAERQRTLEEAERRFEAQQQGILTMGCIVFEDIRNGLVVNLIPLDKIPSIPRKGDFVLLPGETQKGETVGAGEYEVDRVTYGYRRAPEITDRARAAAPLKIIVYMHKVDRK